MKHLSRIATLVPLICGVAQAWMPPGNGILHSTTIGTGTNPIECYSAAFNERWKNVIPLETRTSSVTYATSHLLPTDASGKAVLDKRVEMRGDGYVAYYPWGKEIRERSERKTVFFVGTGPDDNYGGGYCLERASSGMPVTTNAVAMVSCKSCTNKSDYGWQLKIFSKKNLNYEKLSRPVVVTQGFDFGFGGSSSEEMSFAKMEKALNTAFPIEGGAELPTGVKSLERMINDGYDIVLVRFQNPNADIVDQGANLFEAMQGIQKLSNPASSMYLIGPSMGGQVVRTALMKLYDRRQAGDPEAKSLHVSGALLLDSPNMGAAIPASVYFAIRKNSDFDVSADLLYRNLSSPAATQMLIENATNDSWGRSLQSQNFYQALNSEEAIKKQRLGGEIELVAITNGSGVGVRQGVPENSTYFYGAKQMFDYTFHKGTNVSVRVPECMTGSNIVYQTANSVSCLWNDDMITVQVLKIEPIRIALGMELQLNTSNGQLYTPYKWRTFGVLNRENLTTANGGRALENAPGGYFPMYQIIRESFAGVYDKDKYVLNSLNNANFIPFASAAGLISRDVSTWDGVNRPMDAGEKKVFSRVYSPEKNQLHCSLTSQSSEWIMAEIKRAQSRWASKILSSSLMLLD